jgi:hypothetical protein
VITRECAPSPANSGGAGTGAGDSAAGARLPLKPTSETVIQRMMGPKIFIRESSEGNVAGGDDSNESVPLPRGKPARSRSRRENTAKTTAGRTNLSAPIGFLSARPHFFAALDKRRLSPSFDVTRNARTRL